MSSLLTSRDVAFTRIAQGLGFHGIIQKGANGLSTSNAAALSGFFNVVIEGSVISSTYPSSIVSLPVPTGLSGPLRVVSLIASKDLVNPMLLCNFYKMGTLVLTSTGNQFTPDAATFPVLRTRFGVASSPVPLTPIINITTATSVTAPILKIQNATGPAAGYVNQDGTSVTGTKVFTFPTAAVVANSSYILRLEDGDSAVQSISKINVTTASSTGAATIWGMEVLIHAQSLYQYYPAMMDCIFGGLAPADITPGVATSGTISYLLGTAHLNPGSGNFIAELTAVLDTA